VLQQARTGGIKKHHASHAHRYYRQKLHYSRHLLSLAFCDPLESCTYQVMRF
jgi:hypothetical protein